jgi:hypothetical protein
MAVSRRSGDEIHPWVPNGDLRPKYDIHQAGLHWRPARDFWSDTF